MKILITDDLFTNRMQIAMLVKSLGWKCDQASNGDEAIAMIIKNNYDLVLMDIEMPGRNGLETTRYIRDHLPGKSATVPVIAITAHDPDSYFSDFRQYGFDGFIAKPLTKEKLIAYLP
jgi:CheY-like chemotaxis protein